jgi:hypothetical protein
MTLAKSIWEWIKDEWSEIVKAILLIVLVAAFVKFVEFRGWLGSAEGKAIDFLLTWDKAETQADQRIAILEIDDDAYRKCFASTSPLDSEKLLTIIKAMAEAKPKPAVIGVDILTEGDRISDIPTYQEWARNTLSTLSVPIVWAARGTPHVSAGNGSELKTLDPSIWDWMNGRFFEMSLDPSPVLAGVAIEQRNILSAIPVFPKEDDGIVRRLPRRILHNGQARATWAVRVAEEYCVTQNCIQQPPKGEDELFLSYRAPEFTEQLFFGPLRFADYFSCDNGTMSRSSSEFQVAGKIVLIGGNYGNQDVYETSHKPLPGIEINAYSIQAELTGTGIRELPHWYAFFLDILVGIAIAFPMLNWKWRLQRTFLQTGRQSAISKHFVRWMIFLNAAAAILLFAVSVFAVRHHFVWVSWVGMLVALVISLIIDIWREDPQVALRHGPSDHGKHPA